MSGILHMTAEEYHADPCPEASLSSSIARILCDRTPLHAWTAHPRLNPNYQPEESKAFAIGTAAHALLLQGDVTGVEIIGQDNYRTKVAQEARDAAYAAGKVPVLQRDWDQVQQMVEAVASQIEAHEASPLLFAPGKAEQTLVWDEGGVTCRARVDWLHDDYAAIDDLKTTSRSADPKVWSRAMIGFGGDIQIAFYRRGLKAVTGKDADFRFVIVETTPPYALSVVSLAPSLLALADAKVEFAINKWRECMFTGKWPGYTTRVCYAETTVWQEADWLEREELAA